MKSHPNLFLELLNHNFCLKQPFFIDYNKHTTIVLAKKIILFGRYINSIQSVFD